MIQRLIIRKAYSTEPSFGTYEDTRDYSQIKKLNTTPYPFYFVSQPLSDHAVIYSRCAGWSPELLYYPKKEESDPYPKHCFQAACNTQYSKSGTQNIVASKSTPVDKKEDTTTNNKTTRPSSDTCSQQNCINLFR